MRSRRLALFAMGIMAVIGACLAIAAIYEPSSAPAVGIVVLNYTSPKTNSTLSGYWVHAVVAFTNKGTSSVTYQCWGWVPYGWVNAQTGTGTTNGYLAPPFTGGYAVVRPKSSTTFDILLPAETLKWQCGFSIHRASTRERALFTRFGNAICALHWAPEWTIRLLPDNAGPECGFKSDEFVTGFAVSDKSALP